MIKDLLQQLKNTQSEIDKFEEYKQELRNRILIEMKENGFKSVKEDIGSVTFVERKTIKIENREKIIQNLINQGLTNFLDDIPDVFTPAHFELNKDFDDRVKKGLLIMNGVEVITIETPMIKFN